MKNVYLYGANDNTAADFEKAVAGLEKKGIEFTQLFYSDIAQIPDVLNPVRDWFPGIDIPGFPFMVWDTDEGRKVAVGSAEIIKGKAREPVVDPKA